jgi:uncharacterized membrane protein
VGTTSVGTVRTESTPYLDLWTGGGLAVGLVVAGICVAAGLRGRPPGPVTLGATALLQLSVLVVVAVFLVRTLGGDSPVGPAWELWAYLVTVLMLPAVALLWAREEPTRWSTFVLALAAFVAAVMVARAAQIWAGVGMA